MKLVKQGETAYYATENRGLRVEITGKLFIVENAGLSNQKVALSEEELRALIDLYYEVRPAPISHMTPAEVCEHNWESILRSTMRCHRCDTWWEDLGEERG